jgi:DNA-binding transcriptional regulator GbsR (MarR family)
MNTQERIDKQKALIEEIGMHFDKEGLQPIAGRILGLFIVMDKEQFTFEEITEELHISKSSASIALKNLEIMESIEYITLPGERRRYFRLKKQDSYSMLNGIRLKFTQMLKLFNMSIELKADKNSGTSVYLKELTRYLEFALSNLNEIEEKYLKTK